MGWTLVYDARPNGFSRAWCAGEKLVDHSASVGLLLGPAGEVKNVVLGSPAWKGGFAQGMKIVTVNEKRFTPEVLEEALRAAGSAVALASTKGPPRLLEFSLEQAGETFQVKLDYRGGPQHAHLVRDPGRADLLTAILTPRSSP